MPAVQPYSTRTSHLLARAIRALLTATVAGSAACSASSVVDADRPAAAAATLTGPATARAATTNGRVQCDYSLTLDVQGGETGGQITLLGAEVEWRKPGTRDLLFPTARSVLTADDLMSRWFKATRFTTGQTRTVSAVAGVTPHRAFDMVHELRYRADGGPERTTTYTLACQ